MYHDEMTNNHVNVQPLPRPRKKLLIVQSPNCATAVSCKTYTFDLILDSSSKCSSLSSTIQGTNYFKNIMMPRPTSLVSAIVHFCRPYSLVSALLRAPLKGVSTEYYPLYVRRGPAHDYFHCNWTIYTHLRIEQQIQVSRLPYTAKETH